MPSEKDISGYSDSDQEWLKRNQNPDGSYDTQRLKDKDNYTGDRQYDSQDTTKYDTHGNYIGPNNSGGGSSDHVERPIAEGGAPAAPTSQGVDPWAEILSGQMAAQTKAQQDYTALQERMYADQQAAAATEKARRDDLYGTLLTRAQQSTAIDPNDPNIKAQTDQFGAATTRQTRDFLADLAERKGPLANINGESRIANEHAGIAKGSLQASLMASELTNRRNEIANSLASMQGMLTADQATGLQKELGLLDNAISQQQLGISNKGLDIQQALGNRGYDVQSQLGNRGLDLDALKTSLLNSQFYAGLGSQNDQFAANLGFNTADRAAYWDAIANGKIKG